jgi:hypothetical protein
MKTRALTALAFVAVTLTGCATQAQPATETPKPSPTVTRPANFAACTEFRDLILQMPGALNSDDIARWDTLRGRFDEVALKASEETQVRMLDLVERWPDYVDIAFWGEVDGVNTAIESVERSCVADGVEIQFATLQ